MSPHCLLGKVSTQSGDHAFAPLTPVVKMDSPAFSVVTQCFWNWKIKGSAGIHSEVSVFPRWKGISWAVNEKHLV